MAKKTIHVHVGPAASTRDADEGEGRWVTISGAHVHIGEGGKIDKGPAALTGKSEHEAHAHGHEEQAAAHRKAAADKGPGHEHTAAHNKAAKAHAMAAAHFKSAHDYTERGDIRNAAMSHKAGEREARIAQGHADATAAKPQQDAPFEKPQRHAALHSEAEDDVKGSDKHEAEHKRLMKLYDGSKADWERQATNRLIQKNGTEAAQHKAQTAHHHALAASEYAKHSVDAADHADALKKIDAAIDAHGKAGGVGYAAKQEELRKARGQHAKVVANVEKSLAKARGELPDSYERGTDHQDLAAAHRSTSKALRHMGANDDANKHEAAADAHEKAVKTGHPQDKEDAHTHTRIAGTPMKPPGGYDHRKGNMDAPMDGRSHDQHAADHADTARRLTQAGKHGDAARHTTAANFHKAAASTFSSKGGASAEHLAASRAAQKATHELGGTGRKFGGGTNAGSPDRKRGPARPAGGGGALDGIAKRAAERAAKDAADQDPKHKK